jgi:hypothetical protein
VDLQPVGRAYRLGPDGLRLTAPATLTLASDAEELAALDLASGVPALLGLLLSSDRTIDFLRNTVTTVDVASGSVTLTGETPHFTDVVKISGPLIVELKPPTVGPLLVGDSWEADVKVTNVSTESWVFFKREYSGDRVVAVLDFYSQRVVPSKDQPVVYTERDYVEVPRGSSKLGSSGHRFECQAAGTGFYQVTALWDSPDVLPSLLMLVYTVGREAAFEPPDDVDARISVKGVAVCKEKPGVALDCDTGVPLAGVPLPPQLVVNIQVQAGTGDMEGTFIVKMTFPDIPDLAALDGWPPSGSFGVWDPGFPAGPKIQGWVFNGPVNLSLDWWGNPDGQYQVLVSDSREPGTWEYNDALGEAVAIEQSGNMVTLRIPKTVIPDGATWYSVVTNVLSGEQPCIGVADGLDAETGQPIYEFPPR